MSTGSERDWGTLLKTTAPRKHAEQKPAVHAPEEVEKTFKLVANEPAANLPQAEEKRIDEPEVEVRILGSGRKTDRSRVLAISAVLVLLLGAGGAGVFLLQGHKDPTPSTIVPPPVVTPMPVASATASPEPSLPAVPKPEAPKAEAVLPISKPSALENAQAIVPQTEPAHPAPRPFTPPPAVARTVQPLPQPALDPAVPVATGSVVVPALPIPEPTSHLAPPQSAPVASAPITANDKQTPAVNRSVAAVQPPVLLKKVTPIYPALAKTAHLSGTVRFNASISRDGTIAKLDVLAGTPMLVSAARDAVKQWVYRPATVDGRPTEAVIPIEISFAPER